jgi:hypothetical protein
MDELPVNRLTAGTIRLRRTGQPVQPIALAHYRPREPEPGRPYPPVPRDDPAPILVLRARYEEDDPRAGARALVWALGCLVLVLAIVAWAAL